MTRAEAEVIESVASIPLTFYSHPDSRFVYLTGPCPLLISTPDGLASCSVWGHRPYNCRRFGCFRPDPSTEPYEREPLNLPAGRLGCANLSDRLRNRAVRRAYGLMQRKAQRWALRHGWDQTMMGRPVGSDVLIYYPSRKAPGS